MLKELTITGAPGDVCAVYKLSPDHNNMPTKGLAWGIFDSDGEFKMTADTDEQTEVKVITYDPSFAAFLEKNWNINTEQ